MFRWDATGALAAPKVPLHVLAGAMDIVTKPEASESIRDHSGASLQVIEGCNHMGFLEGHEVYNAEIAAFVRKVAGLRNINDNSPVRH